MNFYPFHLGDFAKSTAHLSWLESAAYRRLLDLYYSRESPLPDDLNMICRLVVATQKAQRQAVEQVLAEFFELCPNGWVNHRVERELIKMREKIEAADERKNNSSERMQRHRNLRKFYTDELRAVGVIPPFGIKIDELRGLYDFHCNAMSTDMQRERNGADALRVMAVPIPHPTPTPDPRPFPTPISPTTRANNMNSVEVIPPPADVSPTVWRDFLSIRHARSAPMTESALREIRAEAEDAEISLEEALSTCCVAGWTGFKSEWYLNRST